MEHAKTFFAIFVLLCVAGFAAYHYFKRSR
jgi:hypothetical protein